MKKASIKVNFIYTICYEVLIIILPIITSPYVSRVLGAERIGIYSYTYSIANYFVMFSMLGLANYGNREISKCRDDKAQLSHKFCNLYAIHFCVTTLVLVGYCGYYFLSDETSRIFTLIQGLYIVASFFNIDWFFFGLEEFKITVTRNFVVKILTAVSIFLFVKTQDDLAIYILILAMGNLLGQVTVWGYLRKYVFFVKPDLKEMFSHIRPMLVLFVPTIAISIYKVMAKIMLGNMCDKVEVGFYENADKIIGIPLTAITAFGNVMKPRITYIRNKGMIEKAEEYMKASMKYIMMLAYALTFGLISVGDIFAPIFWGTEFRRCGELIMILAFTIPFISFANVIRTQYLLPESKDKMFNVTLICGAVANIIVNSILIPIWGAMGAACGTVIAEMVVCLMQSYFAQKVLPILKFFTSSIVFLAFGIVMCVALNLLKGFMGETLVSLIVLVGVGIVIYIGLCLGYIIVTKDKYIFELLKKK